jgi:septal ring factor EnvC (AmiA/AmiB activator)
MQNLYRYQNVVICIVVGFLLATTHNLSAQAVPFPNHPAATTSGLDGIGAALAEEAKKREQEYQDLLKSVKALKDKVKSLEDANIELRESHQSLAETIKELPACKEAK